MSLTVDLDGETTLVCRRRFAAPPERVFAAHIDPSLIQKWMTGPEGWSMPVCECDARPGGESHYTWSNGEESFSMTAIFEELEPPRRIVHRERWDAAAGMPDNLIETVFDPDGDGTAMTMRIVYPSAEAREEALKSGMVEGMDMSYERIDGLS